MKNEDSKLNRTTLLVLSALSNGPMHGYEISKFLDAKSNGFFRMPFGSLYPVLHRLEVEKFIGAKWEDSDSQKPRKIYLLNARGKKALEEEVQLFRTYAKALNQLLPEGV